VTDSFGAGDGGKSLWKGRKKFVAILSTSWLGDFTTD
jgi:hypothetical protein